MMEPVSYGNFSPAFLEDLADYLRGKKVLEIMAGNGLLAAHLSRRGVSITATSLFAGHDGHDRGFQHPVIEMTAAQAIEIYGGQADVLLVSWPTTTEAMTMAALAWGDGKPIVFIGEMPRPEFGMAGLAGCASDSFFASIDVDKAFASYKGRGQLDRAVILHVKPDCVAEYRCCFSPLPPAP